MSNHSLHNGKASERWVDSIFQRSPSDKTSHLSSKMILDDMDVHDFIADL